MTGVFVLSFGIPRLIAWRVAYAPIEVSVAALDPTHFDYVVVVGRGPERMRADETTLPLRGGRLAVYRQRDGRLEKESEEWACRTESTGLHPPVAPDLKTVEKFVNNQKRPYLFGYVSVPCGFYRLYDASTERRRQFALSDWQRGDGQITLASPQVLRVFAVPGDTSATMSSDRVTSVAVIAATLEKNASMLHGSPTVHWSHRESNGCLNLYGSDALVQDSDWAQFLRFIDTRRIDTKRVTLGLCLMALDDLCASGTKTLPKRLRLRQEGSNWLCEPDA
ncbi:MAG: hypothetical protein N2111_00690 [Candidatus Sumerlaeaceae bacterium]|nr:hypothetical protein [Candidatus Sumerlaeaceae bacterium]